MRKAPGGDIDGDGVTPDGPIGLGLACLGGPIEAAPGDVDDAETGIRLIDALLGRGLLSDSEGLDSDSEGLQAWEDPCEL
jgi:hypothetical protein